MRPHSLAGITSMTQSRGDEVSQTTVASPVRGKSMEFGKFYQTSYLDVNGNVAPKTSTSTPNLKPPQSFLRPNNFSYNNPAPKFKKNRKSGGMLDILTGRTPSPSPRTPEKSPVKTRNPERMKSPERPPESQEVIKLAHYPSAEVKNDQVPPIEREDWPAPTATAVNMRNLVRLSLARKLENPELADSDDDDITSDPKIQKELKEISKIHDSAMVEQIRLQLIEQIQLEKKKGLDPRSASRVPSANREPMNPPRYVSSVNASPSRSLVDRPRFVSDSEIRHRKKSPVIHASTSSHRYKVKPGYTGGYVSQSCSNVPPGTPGAYVYDLFAGYEHSSDEEDRIPEHRIQVVDMVGRGEDDDDSVFETSNSDISTNSSNIIYSRNTNKSSLPMKELLREPDQPISYEELRLDSSIRKKGVSNTNLEKHLSNEEFERVLGTNRTEFYKLPEFKRNDIKRKVNLF